MKKQIDGQLNLFDYISEEEKKTSKSDGYTEPEQDRTENKKTDKKINHAVENDKTDRKSQVILNHRKSNSIISIYKECVACWCSTCRHNEKGGAVPRDFAGEKKPCPSCDFCIRQEKAEVCEIGSYENGCKLRAEEEGILL